MRSIARLCASELSISVMKNDRCSLGIADIVFDSTVGCVSVARPHDHFYRAIGPERDRGARPNGLPGNELEPRALDQRGEYEKRLLPGEALADAVPVARAEGEVGAHWQALE